MIRIGRLGAALIAALLMAGLLPLTVLAAAPSAVPDSVSTVEDVPLVITMTGTDADGDALSFDVASGPTHGTVGSVGNLDCDGQTPSTCTADVTYTPDSSFHGNDHIDFTVDDGAGGTDTATIAIAVTPRHHAPSGANKTVTTLEDTTYTFATADFGFTDPNDSPADSLQAVKISSLPGAGALKNDGASVSTGQFIAVADITGGQLTFAPAANAGGAGYTSFTFQVRDDGGTANGGADLDPSPSSITINVTTVNDPPAGTNHTVATDENTTYVFDASDFGFTDPNDSPANAFSGVRVATLPAAGTLRNNGAVVTAGAVVTIARINSDDFTFTPPAGASGTPYTTFTFQVQDTGGGANQDPSAATMTVNVTSLNSAPQGTNKTITTLEDTAYTFSVADFGFSDPNDSPPNILLAVKVTTVPADGSLRLNGTAISIGQAVAASDVTAGRLVFTPASNENGAAYASFQFKVQDDGGSGGGSVDTDPSAATITINVTAQNDGPVAVDDAVTFDEDSGTHTLAVLTNDTDPDGPSKTVTGRTTPAHGTLTLVAGVLTYTPNANYNGPDAFNYTVSDGSLSDVGRVTITVAPVNDPPVATDDSMTMLEDPGPTIIDVLDNDSDVDLDTLSVTAKTEPAHGTLALVAGVLTYTPDADYNGPDTFDYTVSDGILADTGTVDITVMPQNDPPIAGDDAATITRDSAANPINVLANDTDADGDTRLITAKTDGAKGTVAITGGGTGLTYDPFTGKLGADSFSYTVSDGHGGEASATVSINITGANRAPNAVNDVGISVPEGAAATSLDVLANDDDPDGDTFTVVARTNGSHGTTRITPGGAGVTYDPATLFYGQDKFTYTISDTGGMTKTATVVVTVTRDTSAPVVVAPAQRFLGQTVGTTTIKARVAWSATDAGSGIKSYQAQVSVNGHSYTTIKLVSPTRTFVDQVLTNRSSYRYRVRATDREGNISAWRYLTISPAVFQEATAAAHYVGAWSSYKTTRALGGAVRYTGTLGRTVTFAYTMSDIGLVMTKTASSGSADIYVDGVLVTRINLHATNTTYRQLVFQRHFTTVGAHTVEVRPIGTGRVDMDAFAVLH